MTNELHTDLATAWETVGKARSELRKVQQRLGEAQRAPPSGGLNETGETSITDYSAFSLGSNQTYNIPSKGRQFPSGATVDSRGWSKHVRVQKSQPLGTRKLSRLEDKYMDPPTLQKGRHVTSKTSQERGRAPQDLPNRDPGLDRNDARAVSPKRVDFSNQLEMRKINPDGTYTDSFALGGGASAYDYGNLNSDFSYSAMNSDPLLSREPHSQSQSNLTDSRAIRETEIRFLNNQRFSQGLDTHPDPYDVRWNKVSSRLTHVDVKVPSATNYRSTVRQPVMGGASRPVTACASTGRDRGGKSDIRQDGYSSATSESSEGGNGKRIKKHLKDFDRDTGELAKLKEKIRQQRLASAAGSVKAPPTREDNPLEGEPPPGGAGSENELTRRLHSNGDPVETLGAAMPAWDTDRFSAAMVRKVAAGPPAPVYKGFNEAESRYKLVKRLEGSRKPNRKKTHKLSPREKRADKNDSFGDGKVEDKPRKRVVASKDRPEKPKPKDVITTSSWRSGQQVVLQTLGPAKPSRPAKSAPAKSTSEPDVESKTCEADKAATRPDPVGGAEQNNDNNVPKVLSDEARKVLNDLHMGQDDTGKGSGKDRDSDKPKRPAVKRKAPKPQEAEKQQPVPKSRHYDSSSVREFMAKQKEERLRRKREEHQTRLQIEAERRKQLEELYKRQKPAAGHQRKPAKPPPKSANGMQKGDQPSKSGVKTVAWGEGEVNKQALTEEKIRRLLGNESDKENKEQLELSDSSSTLTNEDSVGDSTPVATPRAEHPDRGNDVKGSKLQYGRPSMEIDTQIGRIGVQLADSHDPRRQRDLGLFSASGQYRTRAERIQAIRDTAATLQSRLQADTQRLHATESGVSRQAASLPGPSTGQPLDSAARWATLSAGGATRLRDGDGRHTRHDRITGVSEDFTVFNTNLPGVQSLTSHLQRVEQGRAQDAAATRIQSAYRGQAVRQTLDWKLPSGKSMGSKIRAAGRPRKENYEDSAEESSTFSDITITDDSEVESLSSPPRKIGTGLYGRDYHPGDRYRQEVLEQGRQEQAPSAQARPHTAGIQWDKPEADPYSTLNVFARKYQQIERDKLRPTGLSVRSDQPLRERLTTTTTTRPSVIPAQSTLRTEAVFSADQSGRRSPEGLQSSVTEGRIPRENILADSRLNEAAVSRPSQRVADGAGRPLVDSTRSEDVRSRLMSSSFHPTRESDHGDGEEEGTVEGDNSYTQSFDSDNDDMTRSLGNHIEPVAKEVTRSQEVRASFPSHHEASMELDISSMGEEDLPQLSHKMSSGSHGADEPSSTQHPPRFSPNALERKMAAELNLLESMEESMRQLTGVERSRAVSMAQQETVSLAQILKSRQHAHVLEMKELQLRARQETTEASLQLEEVRKRAAEAAQNAAEVITMVRGGETSQSLQESRRKFIQSRTEVAKATEEATRYLAEARGGIMGTGGQGVRRDAPSGRQVKSGGRSVSESRSPTLSTRSVSKSSLTSSYSRSSGEYDSVTQSHPNARPKARSNGSRSLMSGDVITASDSQHHPASSIRTVSGAAGKDDSKSESIAEDLSYTKASGDDYSMNFDESLTEDEVEEKSFRMVLPSESHRRKAKHQRTQSDVSVTSEDQSVVDEDFSSLFIGEDSFNRFTTEMVSQYMREEELRAQHQSSLLKLREKALREKTKAELAWLDQQKKRMRNKGSDDAYPQLKKRQRGIILKLEQEQAEIKRLQEANLAASKERQMILKQQQELRQLRKTTQNTWEKVQGVRPGRASQPLRAYHRREEIHTEDEVSLALEGSDAGEDVSRKDIKSDSEIYTEPKQKKKSDTERMTKLKNVHLDQRYLTAREKKLRDRRKNAEQLLAWKKKLDDEEKKIYELEQKAIDLWEDGEKKTAKKTGRSEKLAGKDSVDGVREKRSSKGKEGDREVREEKDTSKPAQRSESESSISEAISRSQVTRSEISRSQTSRSRVQSSKRAPGGAEGSESEGSIQEEIQSQSSSNTEDTSTTKHQAGESIHDTIQTRSAIDTYADDSFVSTGSVTPSKKKSPLQKLRTPPGGLLFDPSRSPLSPGRPFSYKRGSESESEDSLHAETASDQSDVEGRIRALKDQLHCRKLQFDRLKKESEKQQKEKLKTHEQSLKKQIEAYDNSIKQMTVQLQNELEHEPVRTGKKPQIKHPRGRECKQKVASPEEASPGKSIPPQRSESESSRSSQSSSFEECRESFDSSQTSPVSGTDGVLTSPSVHRKDASASGKKASLLESISERSETPPSERARRSLLANDKQPAAKETYSKISDGKTGVKFSEEEAELALPIDNFAEDSETSVVADAEKPSSLPARGADKVGLLEPTPLSARSDLTPRQPGIVGSEILSARSEISEHITENVPSQASIVSYSEEGLGFKPLGVVQTEDLAARRPSSLNDETSQAAEDEGLKSARSDVSRYSYSTTKTEQSQSEKSEVSYSEDFSEAETGVSEKGKVSKSLGKHESGLSEDDISEELSMASDVSEKTSSAPLLDLRDAYSKRGEKPDPAKLVGADDDAAAAAKTSADLDQDLTPLQSPRDNLLEFTPAAPTDSQPEVVSGKVSPKLSDEQVVLDEDESLVTDSELDKVISSTAAAVEQFDSTPFSSPEHVAKPRTATTSPGSPQRHQQASEKLVDSITNGLIQVVLKDSMSAMSQIASRRSPVKTPPPTLPKPSRDVSSPPASPATPSSPGALAASPTGPSVSPAGSPTDTRPNHSDMQTDSVMSNLLNEAICDMITIRNKQRDRSQSPKSPDSVKTPADQVSPVSDHPASSPDSLPNGLHREEDPMMGVPRPGSPLPGEKQVMNKEELMALDDDLMNIYGGEDEYHDDDEWFHPSPVPNKPPPPYPGTADQQGHIPIEVSRMLQIEQPQYAIPHKREDVMGIVGNAVDVFWMRRRYGKPLEDVQPPETYFSKEDNGIDMDSTSRRAYKNLLFNLTGEIIRDVYKEEEEEDVNPPPWRKPKRKQQKYYKGAEPPTTVDVLTKLVQETAVGILGLNGTPKLDPRLNKWGARKKKDNVDSILVEELREEEPHWVNYDDDELKVKMRLTDTIFDWLLQDTVQTMNRIVLKRKNRPQEPG